MQTVLSIKLTKDIIQWQEDYVRKSKKSINEQLADNLFQKVLEESQQLYNN